MAADDSRRPADSESSPAPSEGAEQPTLSLRDPVVAAILAFLVPGAGHLYQGRVLKSVIYAGCVFGLFGWGMAMAGGQCVSFRPATGEFAGNRKEFIHYLGQVGAGLVALPAVVQYRRYFSPANQRPTPEAMTADFEGLYQPTRGTEGLPDEQSLVAGTLTLSGKASTYGGTTGSLQGQVVAEDGTPRDLSFTVTLQDVEVDRRIDAAKRRPVRGAAIDEVGRVVGQIEGSIPRPLLDRYQVPLSPEAERQINRRLGTTFDLAAVMTMIAGLLNFLAIYDAYAGPAFGYELPKPTPATDEAT